LVAIKIFLGDYMKLIVNTVKMVTVQDWDKLVESTYKKPYRFQQQDGCQDRGIFNLTVPSKETNDDDMNDSIPEEINGSEMGVKFKVWLARDPKQLLENNNNNIILFWERNFYPDIHTVANDLYAKGLIEAGEYIINIDW
jgi:hypothetical protein